MEDIEPFVPVVIWLLMVHHRHSEGEKKTSGTLEITGEYNVHVHAGYSNITTDNLCTHLLCT